MGFVGHKVSTIAFRRGLIGSSRAVGYSLRVRRAFPRYLNGPSHRAGSGARQEIAAYSIMSHLEEPKVFPG